MKLIMRIRNNSVFDSYGVALVPATPSSGEKARPRVTVAGESWVEERKLPKTAAKTISDGDDIFKTQERTISGAKHARKAQKQAKKEHACHDFGNLANKSLYFWWYL